MNIQEYKQFIDSISEEYKASPDIATSKLENLRDQILQLYGLTHDDIVISLLDMGHDTPEDQEARQEDIEDWEKQLKWRTGNTYVYELDWEAMITSSGDDYITVITTKPIDEDQAAILADLYYSWSVGIGPKTGIPIWKFSVEGKRIYPSAESTSPQPQKQTPTGTCYSDAWRFLLKREDGFLVHGSVQIAEGPRIQHAWVELDTGWAWEPQTGQWLMIEDFKRMFTSIEEARYTGEEAAIMVARSGKHGPWSKEERKEYIGR